MTAQHNGHDLFQQAEDMLHPKPAQEPFRLEQRLLLAAWGVGLLLIPLKLVGLTPGLDWAEATFPLWGGTTLFLAWGLLAKAVRRG